MRVLAEAIGRAVDVPAGSIAVEDAPAHFGWISRFVGMDAPASSTGTQELLGWRPAGPTIVEDLDAGAYGHA
jgi:nucleoside-diphosphate-sugar epimerase